MGRQLSRECNATALLLCCIESAHTCSRSVAKPATANTTGQHVLLVCVQLGMCSPMSALVWLLKRLCCPFVVYGFLSVVRPGS